MTRVLFYNPHQGFDSGAPKVLATLTESLFGSEFEPVYLATGDGPLVDALSQRGVRIERGQVSKAGYRRPLRSLRNIARQAQWLRKMRIDLLHVFDYGWNLDLVLGAWLARIPVILHEHLGGSADFQNLHRFAARRVLFCSKSILERFGHRDRIQGKSRVIYNPVDVSAFAHGKPIRDALGLRSDQIVIGTVARLQHTKGMDILLETARFLIPKHKDLVFVVAGGAVPGQEGFAERVLKDAGDPAFDGRVRFLGARHDIPDLMATMDVFFFPARAEAFGMPVVEAMAAGLPVVASRVGGIPEVVVSPDLGILVQPLSPGSFASAIGSVLKMEDRGRAMGERARESVIRRFDATIVSRQIRHTYRELTWGRPLDSRREAPVRIPTGSKA